MKKLFVLVAIILCGAFLLTACGDDGIGGLIGGIGGGSGEVTLGQTFEVEGLEITLSRNIGFAQFRSSYSDLDGAYVFYIPATVKNIGNTSHGLNQWAVNVFSPEGVSLTNTVSAYDIEWAFEEESIFSIGNVQPGVTKEGNIYVLYDEDGEYIIEFSDFTGEEVKTVDVKFELEFDFDAVPVAQTEFRLGETLDIGGLEITFRDNISWGTIRDNYSSHNGSHYFVIPVTLRNASNESKRFPWGFKAHGPNGNELDSIRWDVDGEDITDSGDILPGATSEGYLHVLYAGDGVYTLIFSDYELLDDLSVNVPVRIDLDAIPVIETEFTLDDTFMFDDLEITIKSDVKWETIDNRWSDFHEREIMVLPITVTNIGDSTNNFPWNVKLFGPNGIELDGISYYVDDDVTRSGDIRSGATLNGKLHILFDGFGEYVIEFSDFREGETQVIFTVYEED